jgi:glucose-1-phosphate cytidylyltransferase
MKTVLLAGGLGTRIGEETHNKPKPMVEIGGWPIIWHIMNIYAHYGHNEFVVALGYRGSAIKDFFLNYHHLNSNLRIDLSNGDVQTTEKFLRDWIIHLIDTGANSMTGGRIGRLREHLRDETFMLTYGDGVCNLDIEDLVQFHRSHGKLATVTTVRPAARFGGIELDSDQVVEFKEKPHTGEGWINGGYFVFEPGFLDYIDGDDCILEREPLERLAAQGELMAYRHDGFWQCMDTMRDRQLLEELWSGDAPPWKIWTD